MNKNQNYYGGGGNYGNKFGMGGGMPLGRDDGRMMVWEASRMLQDGFLAHGADMPRLLELAQNLSQYLEHTRTQYNRAVSDRDAAQRRLQDANSRLSQVESLVKRYAVVREPVIASDGYTYESDSITKYLNECSSGNSKAYSQQTKEELSDVIVPNRSLHRLVTHLKEVRPIEVPPPTHRAPITALPGAVPPRAAWIDDELVGGNPSNGPMPVQPLDGGSMPPQQGGAVRGPIAVGAGASIGGITVPAPASASNKAGGRVGRFEGGGRTRGVGGGASRPALHPCLRVYGFCNFMDDCTFANYPYEACLNHIKGKCRFGQNCKELHVDPRDPRYQNARSYANQHNHGNNNNNNNQMRPTGEADTEEKPTTKEEMEEKATEATASPGADSKRSKDSSVRPAGEAKAEKNEEGKSNNESAKAEEATAEADVGE